MYGPAPIYVETASPWANGLALTTLLTRKLALTIFRMPVAAERNAITPAGDPATRELLGEQGEYRG